MKRIDLSAIPVGTCRECGSSCAPIHPSALCENCCRTHQYEYIDVEGEYCCTHCGKYAPPEYYRKDEA